MTDRDLQPIPDVTDWKVLQDDNRVFVESAAIAHTMRNYDDAWLQVAGNMLADEKLKIAEFVVAKLNKPTANGAGGQPSLGSHASGFTNEFGQHVFIDAHTIGGGRMRLEMERDDQPLAATTITDAEGRALLQALRMVLRDKTLATNGGGDL